MKPKFQIGEVVWRAHAGQVQKWVICPDFFGKRVLRVMLGDGTEHVIDCAGCQAGSDPPRGRVTTLEFSAEVMESEITGLEAYGDKVRYHFSCYVVDQENV